MQVDPGQVGIRSQRPLDAHQKRLVVGARRTVREDSFGVGDSDQLSRQAFGFSKTLAQSSAGLG